MLKGQEIDFPSDLNSISDPKNGKNGENGENLNSSANKKVQISSVYDLEDSDKDCESKNKNGENEKLKYNESIGGDNQNEDRAISPLQNRRIIKKNKNFEFQTPTKDRSNSPSKTTTGEGK